MRPAPTAALALITGLLCTAPVAVAAPRWRPPVAGPPTRLFALGADPFARGQHRGVDFAARGSVRAACSGVVVFAGRVAGAGTVSERCGGWRVSYAPLAHIPVRAGRHVVAGQPLGRVGAAAAPAHLRPSRADDRRSGAADLHFGVRREGARFGYVDPLRFLTARRAPPPPVAPPLGRRPSGPALRSAPRAPAPAARRLAARAHAPPPLAPWPVWAGLVLVLTGLAGAGRLTPPVRNRRLARAARRPLRVPLR